MIKSSPYEPYNNQIGVKISFIVKDEDKRCDKSADLISYGAYKQRCNRLKGFRLKEGKGLGNEALVSWNNLPDDWKELLIEKFGDPTKEARPNVIERFYERSPKAADFYANYLRPCGRNLDAKHIKEYITNASVLDAYIKAESYLKSKKKALGGSGSVSQTLIEDLEDLRSSLDHTIKIPSIKRTIRSYKKDGYEAIISKKFGNDNSRKVTALVESMLLSLYTLPNKPFGSSVHQLYKEFLSGNIKVVDKRTGEYFNLDDFMKNGIPLEISEATVWNYINDPENRAIVDKVRMDGLDYNNTHRPHARRHLPNFSFSKISMDDRDLPRKLKSGDRVKAYYAYDVKSGAIIGKAYSRSKNEELFIDCLRDMFRLIDRKGWGVPMEVEVENHLVNKFFDDLGVMFPILRICAPGNSQEKHAEHYNKAKKYGVEKSQQNGIGRWWAKSEAYRTPSKKVNDEYVERGYEYETLVADDLRAINDYNNQPHPQKNKYPGMTRWDVLVYNLNPDCIVPNRAVWIKSIGDKTISSIKRSKYITVKNNEYELPSPQVLSRLKPNNYTVDAYYLQEENGKIKEVYLYQFGEFICKASFSETYNTAKAEWTKEDKEVYQEQSAYTGRFDTMVKKGREEKLFPAYIETAEHHKNIETIKPKIVESPNPDNLHFDFERASKMWDNDWNTDRAIDNI